MQLLPMLVTALQESEQSQLLKKYGATLAKHTETASTLLDMLNLVLDDKARLNKNSYLAGTGRAMAVRSEVNGLLDMSRWPIVLFSTSLVCCSTYCVYRGSSGKPTWSATTSCRGMCTTLLKSATCPSPSIRGRRSIKILF